MSRSHFPWWYYIENEQTIWEQNGQIERPTLWGNFAKNRKDFDKEGTTKVQYKIIGGNQIALQLFAHGIFSFISAAFNPLTPV